MDAGASSRLRFMAAVCTALNEAGRNKVTWFRCPLCGKEACAVWLGDGHRRGVCSCGVRFFEEDN